jgi:type II secretory pathway component PulK
MPPDLIQIVETRMHITRSLEDYRHERLLDIGEFAAFLGITEQTYRRLLTEPEKVRMTTKRQVRERIGVAPALIAELAPRPSLIVQAQIQAIIDESDRNGWIAYNSDTLEPTREQFLGDGQQK